MHKPIWPEGRYLDRVVRCDGATEECGWRSNIVVDRCRHLLAAFLKGDGAAAGIDALAIGRGDPSWDDATPPTTATAQQLTDAAPVIVPVAKTDILFLDATGAAVNGPTQRLQITVTLAPGTPPPDGGNSYPLREFALFGSYGGERYMIDYVRHPVINKSAGDTLVRTIRLIF